MVAQRRASSVLLNEGVTRRHHATKEDIVQMQNRDDEPVGDNRKQVNFANVTVLDFPMQLGANTSMRSPLTIGWKFLKRKDYDIDRYEEMRPASRRRPYNQLRIPEEERTNILLKQGYSLQEIATTAVAAFNQKKLDSLYGALVKAGQQLSRKTNVLSL
jgi:hypothetical protein